MYLSRNIDEELLAWRKEREGKPLLIRGARQVGKSTAVRELAKQFEYFLEINFEEQRQVHKIFEDGGIGDSGQSYRCQWPSFGR